MARAGEALDDGGRALCGTGVGQQGPWRWPSTPLGGRRGPPLVAATTDVLGRLGV
jgi:hypothetical protein